MVNKKCFLYCGNNYFPMNVSGWFINGEEKFENQCWNALTKNKSMMKFSHI